MTTTVKIEAHCGQNKEVVIAVLDGNQQPIHVVLNDGEKYEVYAYDERIVTVKERSKIQ